jgi:putative component of toxin-antitoxin plasmid stabilization module
MDLAIDCIALGEATSWSSLLCGGDKSSQSRDIEAAKRLLKEIGDVDG